MKAFRFPKEKLQQCLKYERNYERHITSKYIQTINQQQSIIFAWYCNGWYRVESGFHNYKLKCMQLFYFSTSPDEPLNHVL